MEELHAFIMTVEVFLSDIAIDLVHKWSVFFQMPKKISVVLLTLKSMYYLLECHEVVIRLQQH